MMLVAWGTSRTVVLEPTIDSKPFTGAVLNRKTQSYESIKGPTLTSRRYPELKTRAQEEH